jgi:hypothetical protein
MAVAEFGVLDLQKEHPLVRLDLPQKELKACGDEYASRVGCEGKSTDRRIKFPSVDASGLRVEPVDTRSVDVGPKQPLGSRIPNGTSAYEVARLGHTTKRIHAKIQASLF